jgi:hypothetical protein
MTTDAVHSIQAIITKDARALNRDRKLRLEKYVQKLTDAANISFTERDLQKEYVRFLRKTNDESKDRRSTWSIVLGKARVMVRNDLVKARMERAEKEQNAKSKGKGKRGRKRKVQELEEPVIEQRAPVARII